MKEELAQFLTFAHLLADEAAYVSLCHFRSSLKVKDKGDKKGFSPLTIADQEIEALLRARIESHYPSHSILGEEQPPKKGDGYEWVLDPIDGTKSFIAGLPIWGTLIGLRKHNKMPQNETEKSSLGTPLLGLMDQPFIGERFFAVLQAGAFHQKTNPIKTNPIKTNPIKSPSTTKTNPIKQTDTKTNTKTDTKAKINTKTDTKTNTQTNTHKNTIKPIHTSHCKTLKDALLATCSLDHLSDKHKTQLQALGQEARFMQYEGDCYNYALLASGHIDVVIDFALKPYDIQAMMLIVKEAGGVITSWKGDEDLATGNVVASANPTLHKLILQKLKNFH